MHACGRAAVEAVPAAPQVPVPVKGTVHSGQAVEWNTLLRGSEGITPDLCLVVVRVKTLRALTPQHKAC